MKTNYIGSIGVFLIANTCAAADWRLIERFNDMEMYYDASSIVRNKDEVVVTTLVNYFKTRNRGEGEFKSKTSLHTVYCSKEQIVARYSVDFAEHFAGGKIVDEGEIDPHFVDAKSRTIAGEIHNAVCRIGA